MSKLSEDPVVAEIHAIRQALLDASGGDINAYRRLAEARQNKSGRRIISVPFRKRTEQVDVAEVRAPRVPVVGQPPHPADQ